MKHNSEESLLILFSQCLLDVENKFLTTIKKVEIMIGFLNMLIAIKTPQEKTALQRQIEATDKQIDQLVYQLYGLTEEEIRIVEWK